VHSCSIAVTRLIAPILERNGLPGSAASLVCGDVEVGKELVGSKDVDMGEPVAALGSNFGRVSGWAEPR
jgi:acyl-CoA reductase-like NAD-dependent aldehyde dehydrogenase